MLEIPKIIQKGSNTFEFERKIKDNMYLYREKKCGYTTTFCNHELGLVKEQMPGTKDLSCFPKGI